MGKKNDPDVAETFAVPKTILKGNRLFHDNHIQYLRGWLHDYDAAREAVFCKSQVHGADVIYEYYRIERDAGNHEKALELLNGMQSPSGMKENDLSKWHLDRMYDCIDLEEYELAEQHLGRAIQIYPHNFTEPGRRADIMIARKDWEEGLKLTDQAIRRQRATYEYQADRAHCLLHLDRADEAKQIMEPWFQRQYISGNMYSYMWLMMHIYAETMDKDKADELMNLALRHPKKRRRTLASIIKHYKEIHPDKGQGIEENMGEIMEGPTTLGAALKQK